MSRIEILSAATAPEAARARVETAEKNNGFLPNLIGVLANAPSALATYQDVGALNAATSLSASEREIVQLVAARENACGFCTAGHTAISTKKNLLTAEEIAAVREDGSLENSRYAALAAFAKSVIINKGNVSDADWNSFTAQGYTAQQALEVVLGVSLATLCNFANNLAQTPINPQLQPFA